MNLWFLNLNLHQFSTKFNFNSFFELLQYWILIKDRTNCVQNRSKTKICRMKINKNKSTSLLRITNSFSGYHIVCYRALEFDKKKLLSNFCQAEGLVKEHPSYNLTISTLLFNLHSVYWNRHWRRKSCQLSNNKESIFSSTFSVKRTCSALSM